MSEMGEMFNAMRAQTKLHHAEMLAKADITGWTRHTDYHFSRMFGNKRVNWWPSSGKAQVNGCMIYGHKKVNAMIARLKKESSNE